MSLTKLILPISCIVVNPLTVMIWIEAYCVLQLKKMGQLFYYYFWNIFTFVNITLKMGYVIGALQWLTLQKYKTKRNPSCLLLCRFTMRKVHKWAINCWFFSFYSICWYFFQYLINSMDNYLKEIGVVITESIKCLQEHYRH